MNNAAILDLSEAPFDLPAESSGSFEAVDNGETVTAIIPTFGRPLLAMRAIESALDQTYRRLEVILVIDGNDEQTRPVALAVSAHDPRLRVVQLRAKVGAAHARNIGVGLAGGEWVAFLDDDDEWLPGKIAAQVEAALVCAADQPVLSSRIIVRNGTADWISPRRLYSLREPMSEYLFCRRNFIDGARYMQTSSLLMRRSLMLELPFRQTLKRHQDWDWLLRAAEHPDVAFYMVPEPLAIFNVEPGRESLGRALDWEYSESWVGEMRASFTPRAYSFFIANECVSRAVKAQAGGAVYARLTREFFSRGRPTLRSLASLAGFLCLPETVRTQVRQSVRSLRSRTRSGTSIPSSQQA